LNDKIDNKIQQIFEDLTIGEMQVFLLKSICTFIKGLHQINGNNVDETLNNLTVNVKKVLDENMSKKEQDKSIIVH
jgi:hypothetical protein